MTARKRPARAKTNRAIAYLRCSTEDQGESGLGLEAQYQTISAEADRRGWELRVSQDVASGGSLSRRPELLRALELLRTGEADLLVVAKLDRLSRSVMDFADIVARSQREGWAIVALDLGVDTSTPAGEMVANVMATFAQYERRLIGQRTKDALAQKRAQGYRLGRPVLVPGAVRDTILAAREAGQSYRTIAAALNAEGIPTAQGGRCWYAATVRAVEQRAA